MTLTDRTIAAMGLPAHPQPLEIAKVLREAARELEEHGLDGIDRLHVLSARGYAAMTLGDGGSRGSDGTSSTERNAMKEGDERRWYGKDVEHATDLRSVWLTAVRVVSRNREARRHAQDIDPTPAGTGECLACGRFCRPTESRPGNRIVSGLCRASCYPAWVREDRPLRVEWIAKRKRSLTDEAGTLHTPEPDVDADLSTELSVPLDQGVCDW